MEKKIFKILLVSILILNMNCISFAQSDISDSQIIESMVEDLKNYYTSDEEYSFREAIALNFTSENIDDEIEKIADKLSIKEDVSATAYAGNIIGIIAAGKNPQDYEGKDYIKLLVDSQQESGEFLVVSGDKHPATLAWSIIALDMTQAQYDIEKVVTALLEKQKENGAFTDNLDVDTTAMVITALAGHKDIEGVQEGIDKALEFIKSMQLDSGGFPFMGSDNPYSLSTVIQGLIANEIDPLSEEWKKDGNSMLDALQNFKEDNHFEYKTKWGSEINSATEQAFIALADLYRGKSMYQSIKIYEEDSNNQEDNAGGLSIERIDNEIFQNGKEGKLDIKIKNGTEEDQEVTFIVVLYGVDNDEMIAYSYLTKTIANDKEEIIAIGFLIPEKGDYEVRGFLWDNLDDMNVLTEPIYVDVD